MVRDMAAALRVNGLLAGDRVAGKMPLTFSKRVYKSITLLPIAIVTNSIDAIVIAFATASIGGIFSSTAPDMGVQVCYITNCQERLSTDCFCLIGDSRQIQTNTAQIRLFRD